MDNNLVIQVKAGSNEPVIVFGREQLINYMSAETERNVNYVKAWEVEDLGGQKVSNFNMEVGGEYTVRGDGVANWVEFKIFVMDDPLVAGPPLEGDLDTFSAMAITTKDRNGNQFSMSAENPYPEFESDLMWMLRMFKQMLLAMGYHPETVEKSILTEDLEDE